jgi:hypothetical protein
MPGSLALDGTVASGEADLPTALGRHLEKLIEAIPSNQGLAEEGPASDAEAAHVQRAYPADVMSLETAAASLTP